MMTLWPSQFVSGDLRHGVVPWHLGFILEQRLDTLPQIGWPRRVLELGTLGDDDLVDRHAALEQPIGLCKVRWFGITFLRPCCCSLAFDQCDQLRRRQRVQLNPFAVGY